MKLFAVFVAVLAVGSIKLGGALAHLLGVTGDIISMINGTAEALSNTLDAVLD
ncbi:hypothetical protein Bhyg_05937, partial [Pseudolycoriella hygida]